MRYKANLFDRAILYFAEAGSLGKEFIWYKHWANTNAIYDMLWGTQCRIKCRWVLEATVTFHISITLKEFCGLTLYSGEQHEDFCEDRMNRDAADISKFSTWFQNHTFFLQIDKIISMFTEVIEDETVTFKARKSGVKRWFGCLANATRMWI